MNEITEGKKKNGNPSIQSFDRKGENEGDGKGICNELRGKPRVLE